MLKLFRRHADACLLELDKKNLKPTAIRCWEHCDCPVWFSGTWNGRSHPRTSLKINDWNRAERELDRVMRGEQQTTGGMTIEAALEKWHRDCELPPARSAKTMQQHRRMGDHLVKFAAKHHVRLLVHFDLDLLNEWRSEWTISESSHRTRLGFIGAFFNYCSKQQNWIPANPVDRIVKPPAVPPDKEDTRPIDEDDDTINYRALIRALTEPLAAPYRPRYVNPLIHDADRKIALTQVQYHSGLRIGDAIVFDLRKLTLGPDCASYEFVPTKTRGRRRVITTFMPLWLAHKLRSFKATSRFLSAHHPFRYGSKTTIESIAHAYYMELRRIGDVIGVADLRAHRLRNSFAVNALNRGVELSEVSRWLGHSSIKTTETYYSPWVQSRKDRSRRIYAQSHDMANLET